MLVDLRPISSPLVVVGSYEVAEQIVKASRTSDWAYLDCIFSGKGAPPIVDLSSYEAGESWKAFLKRFSTGFAPQHLLSLLSSIIDKSILFLHRLDNLSRSGKEFLLQDLATNLTFHTIGPVVLDIDMGAHNNNPTHLMRIFHELIQTCADEWITLPWWCTPQLEAQSSREAGQRYPKSIVRERYTKLDLNPKTVDVTCDQLSTLLFADHDTTSTTIAWRFYELSRTPHALRAVHAELDELFGPNPTGPGGEEHIHRMTYTAAVIREVLQLRPPDGTARTTKPGDGLRVTLLPYSSSSSSEMGEMDLDGLMLYPIHYIIQRDPAVFGDIANAFVSER
ncbi:cytochrome P450 [Hypoxylon cercidicola]|nr:cytochrome P450 [Hypoxylon cercidicola]